MKKHYILIVIILLSINCTIQLYAQNNKNISDIPFNCSCKIEKFKKVYTDVEKYPEYIDGYLAYTDIWLNNRVYTDSICNEEIYLSFVVDTNGKVTNKCILNTCFKDRLTEYEKKELDVLDKIGEFIPGENNGKKVPVQIKMPIKSIKVKN